MGTILEDTLFDLHTTGALRTGKSHHGQNIHCSIVPLLSQSHGREKLEGDKPDFSKGSFYANPLTEDLAEAMMERRRYQRARRNPGDDHPIDNDMEELLCWDASINVIETDEELHTLAKANPAFFAPNIWPSTNLPDLESAFVAVGRLVHEVGSMVAKCCDSYVSSKVS